MRRFRWFDFVILAAIAIVAVLLLLSTSMGIDAQWNEPTTGRGNTGVPANLVFTNKPLAADVPVVANTTTAIDDIALAALPAACGSNSCRLRVSYAYYISGGSSLNNCYATDGTNTYGQSGSTLSSNQSYCNNSVLSPQTFSAGATPTITIDTYDYGVVSICAFRTPSSASAVCDVGSGLLQGYMQVEVVESK
jgi:hypothetical protein